MLVTQIGPTEMGKLNNRIAELAQSVGELLLIKRLTVSTAESCTGGLLSAAITSVAGSSDYYFGSVIAYSNEVKNKILDVPQEILETKGAVSPEVGNLLARGIRRLLGSSVGLGITGIAGPGGGSVDKPVGLVYIALDSDAVSWCQSFHFSGDRRKIRMESVEAALEMLRRFALEQ